MISQTFTLTFFILLNLILIITFKRNKLFNFIIDKPDGIRKLHHSPTPLAGGMIIFINFFLYFILYNLDKNLIPKELFFEDKAIFFSFFFSFMSIFILGIIDDKIVLNPSLKFLILLLIIFFLLRYDESLILSDIELSFYSKNIYLGKYGIIFTIFCFLVFLNAFNMFDGINLQSGLYSIFIFLNIFYYSKISILIIIIIVSLICFSYLNYKNLTFFGDSGTLIIAFLISYLFIKLYNLEKITYADEIVIFMIIPGLDLIRLFIIRIIQKRNPLNPDRLHLHHLLSDKYSYKKTILIIFSLIFFPISLNYLNINSAVIILITISLYSSIVLIISKKN
jgi:UDP-GlcNAc:undecaprenyl-phosphate GlcNAc-1-phosphate transferase